MAVILDMTTVKNLIEILHYRLARRSVQDDRIVCKAKQGAMNNRGNRDINY